MTTAEELKAAQARIWKGWCRGWYAHDVNGRDVDPRAPEAVSWCLFGALLPDMENTKLTDADWALVRASGDNQYLGCWNDDPERTIEEVIGLYDKAIAIAEAESKPGAAAS